MNSLEENRQLFLREYNKDAIDLESKPLGLVVLLTTRCNLSCIMCEWWNQKPADLPYEAIEKILPFLPALEMINWQGGEPFIVPYFQELFTMVAFEYPHVKQSISTNGLMIDKNWAGILAQSYLDITFSIDGPEKKTYEHIRRGGSYEEIIKSLDNLNNALENAAGCRVEKTLFAVVMRSNYRHLAQFIDFAKKYGFTKVQFAQKFGDLPEEEIFSPADSEAMNFLKEVIPQIERKARSLGINLTHPFDFLLCSNTSENADEYTDDNSEQDKYRLCSYPWYKMTILPNGDVKPDCICPNIAGNILKDNLQEIWNNPVMQKYRKKIAKGDTKGFCADVCSSGKYLGLRLNQNI